jgi:hypothetical protein
VNGVYIITSYGRYAAAAALVRTLTGQPMDDREAVATT